MSTLAFSTLVILGSIGAGCLGALTGLGGGVVIVPMLTLLFGVDMRYAMGASLISVIATSSGAASAFVREGFSNIRIGLFLEIATTAGALLGAILATRLPTSMLAIVLGLVLLYSAFAGARTEVVSSQSIAGDGGLFRLSGLMPSPQGAIPYAAKR